MKPWLPLLLLVVLGNSGCQGGPTGGNPAKVPDERSAAPSAPLGLEAAAKPPRPKVADPRAPTPALKATKVPKSALSQGVKTNKGAPPALPPSRFRLSTLRAPELQVHETPPPPPTRQPVQVPGPSTNADLKAIVSGINAPKPMVPAGSPPVERIDEKRVRIGRVMVDRARNQVEVDGAVNMTEGILEYYAVGPSGKVHESVITYNGLASQVHLGLLLLGLEPRRRGGPEVSLWISWSDPKTGKKREAPAHAWLRDRSTGKTAKNLVWRFHGSGFFNGRYAGDTAHTLVGLVSDPNVVIALDADSGNPYQGANLGFEVMTKKIPPKGTPMTLLIRPKGK